MRRTRLRRDARVVRAREPQRRPPAHPRVPRHDVLQRHEHRVAHVQRAGDVRRRHRDRERLADGVVGGLKASVRLPPLVQALLRSAVLEVFREVRVVRPRGDYAGGWGGGRGRDRGRAADDRGAARAVEEAEMMTMMMRSRRRGPRAARLEERAVGRGRRARRERRARGRAREDRVRGDPASRPERHRDRGPEHACVERAGSSDVACDHQGPFPITLRWMLMKRSGKAIPRPFIGSSVN